MKRHSVPLIVALLLLGFAIGLSACGNAEIAPEQILVTRTPLPEPEEDALTEGASEIAEAVGLGESDFLGLTAALWIDIGISMLIVFAGYLVGVVITHGALRRIVSRTSPEFGRAVLDAISAQIRWLVTILALQLATIRLVIINTTVRRLLLDAYFIAILSLLMIMIWRLISVSKESYTAGLGEEGQRVELEPAMILLSRIGRATLIVVGASLLLSHFGINIFALTAVLGIGGLALSLGARDTIADAIAGFIILFDRPFRIGDRIEIQEIDTWGDVTEIGLRTTRIRTRDNRLVIVPNSIIGSNQIINYSYPDPRYRIQIHVSIAYGTDLQTVRELIISTVREVEGVLQDRPVEALYVEMGDSAMVFRVRWWIESYIDTRRMYDKVNSALQNALDANGIEIPYPTQTFKLEVGSDAADVLTGGSQDPQP